MLDKVLLCFLCLVLPLAIYPIAVPTTQELPGWGISYDLFFFLRSQIVSVVGFILLLNTKNFRVAPLAYLFLLFLSVLFTKFPALSWVGMPAYYEGTPVLIGYIGIMLAVNRTGVFKRLEKCIIASVYLTSLFCILQIIYGNYFDFPPIKWLFNGVKVQSDASVLYSTLANTNHLGLFCSLLFPFCLVKKKWIPSAILIGMALGSNARLSWLSIAITSVLILRKKSILILAIALLFYVPIHKTVEDRIIQTVNNLHWPLKPTDLDGRYFIWKETMPLLRGNTLIGSGPNTYMALFPQWDSYAFFGKGIIVDRPHDIYLYIWQSTGLLSLLVWGWVVLNMLYNCRNKALTMSVIGFLIAGVFTDSMVGVTPYFMILLGAGL